MDITLKPGRYVVAVSGGVDSVALLHFLANYSQDHAIKLTVAHLDHGIRLDSAEDRRLVQTMSSKLGLPFVYHEAALGSGASEDSARQARYNFLHQVRRASGAQAIITAHHADDVLETAVINMIRGSGRRGLTALDNSPKLERPLLAIPKQQLIVYARQHQLQWREDSTNHDLAYTRNYVRNKLLSRFKEDDRQRFHELITELRALNAEIDQELHEQLITHMVEDRLDRMWYVQLPHAVAREVMAAWLRRQGFAGFDNKTIERLTIAAKVGAPGSRYDVMQQASMHTNIDNLALKGYER